MGKIAMVVFAAVFFLVMGVGDATAAEKAQPSQNVTKTSPRENKAQPSQSVTSPSRGAANAQPTQNVTRPSPGAGKAKLPKDVTSIPSGRALNDLATGNQPQVVVFDGAKPNPPPVQVDKSTSTLTPAEQAIKNYKNSGPPPGVRIKPAKEPPPPSLPPKKK
jgi:hypothetical protein